MGLTKGDMLLVITPALSRVSISSCTHLWCFSTKVYGLELIGGLSPVSMSIVTNCVRPMSSFPFEKTLEYLSQSASKADLMPGVMSVSCRILSLCLTGDVVLWSPHHLSNFFMISKGVYFYVLCYRLGKTYNLIFA